MADEQLNGSDMQKAPFQVHMDRLPRSVTLLSDDAGKPVFEYVDERRLPGELVFERTQSWVQVVDAIKTLAVRGAPAIGVAGAASFLLWAASDDARVADMDARADEIANARPTAVNLSWAVNHARVFLQQQLEETLSLSDQGAAPADSDRPLPAECVQELARFVKQLEEDDIACNRSMGRNGAALIEPGSTILTHCNAGSLATVKYGTALSVVYEAAEQGKIERVYADETRPVGQGARLTSWELAQAGVPVTLICDNMAASLMAQGKISACIVGADRIARNGDVANKIGTYGVAVLAKHHGIPFYVVAPTSTLDMSLETGAQIPIEQRASSEVIPAPIPGVDVYNPAFDVTPAELVTAIITETGVFEPSEIQNAL